MRKFLIALNVCAALVAATPAQAMEDKYGHTVMTHPYGFPAVAYEWVPAKQSWVEVSKWMLDAFCQAYVDKHFKGNKNVICLGAPPTADATPADYGMLPEQKALAKVTLGYIICWDKYAHYYQTKLPSDEDKKVDYAVAAMDAADKMCQKQYAAMDLVKPGAAASTRDYMQDGYLDFLGRLEFIGRVK